MALGRSGELLAERLFRSKRHSGLLIPEIDGLFSATGAESGELAGVVVAGGPGSFTGLRVAAATAKGVARALSIPLHAYSGLLARAAGAWPLARPVCALIDARRRDVYAACYELGGKEKGRGDGEAQITALMEPAALSLEELMGRFRGQEPPFFTGEGASLHRHELEEELGAAVAPPHLAVPRASALIWLAEVAPELGRIASPSGWEPEYLRPPGAERIRAGKGASP